MIASFMAGIIHKDWIYFSHISFNALMRINWNTGETEYISTFPDEELDIKLQHSKAICYGDKVVFTPNLGRHVHIYDFYTGEIERIEISRLDSRWAFLDSIIYKDKLWVFPAVLNQKLIKIDLINGEIEECKMLKEIIAEDNAEKRDLWHPSLIKVQVIDKFAYGILHKGSVIMKYSLDDDNVELYNSDLIDLDDIFYLGGEKWITDYSGNIYVWDEETNSMSLKNKSDVKSRSILFGQKDHVMYVPERGGYIYEWDKNANCFQEKSIIETTSSDAQGYGYHTIVMQEGTIFFFPPYGKKIAIMNNGLIKYKDSLLVDNEIFYRIYKDSIIGEIQTENISFSLLDFTKMI